MVKLTCFCFPQINKSLPGKEKAFEDELLIRMIYLFAWHMASQSKCFISS